MGPGSNHGNAKKLQPLVHNFPSKCQFKVFHGDFRHFMHFCTELMFMFFVCNFWYWKWIEREEIKRKWGYVESESLSISSFSLHFLSFSPFPHSLSISSSFSHSLSIFSQPGCQAATSCATPPHTKIFKCKLFPPHLPFINHHGVPWKSFWQA